MITVEEVYMSRKGDKSMLCADILAQGIEGTLYFAVNSKQESFLNLQSGESFIMGILPFAMQMGQDIVYKGQLSERFVHGLNEYLITSLAAAQKYYYPVRVSAESFCNEKRRIISGVGAGAVDCPGVHKLIQDHGKDSLYPVTHLCVLVDEGEDIASNCRFAECAVQTEELETIIVEHNFSHIYRKFEHVAEVCLELAGALALSGGLGMYLFYSDFALCCTGDKQKETSNLDLIISSFASTDKMRIYLFDYENERKELLC